VESVLNAARHPRLLVLRGGALGDFIVTLPALAALRRRWPDAYIELVGYPHIAELARIGGLVDRIASLHGAGIARFFGLRPAFPDEQRAYIRSFDLIFNYFHDPDETVRTNLETAGARQVISGSPIVRDRHAVDHLLKPLESLAIYEAGAAPALKWPADERAEGRARLEALAPGVTWILHPGSGSPKKNWPIGHFIEAARRLRADGRAVVFLLGEADEQPREALARNAPEFPRLEGLSVREAAQTLSAASGYLGNDSGITHLAAALGVRTVALFGPSDPARWAPRGEHVNVLRAASGIMDDLPPDDVWAALGM
jgi:heptosyltransferase-2